MSRHSGKLYKGLPAGSDLRAAEEIVPDDTILSERGFEAIVEQRHLELATDGFVVGPSHTKGRPSRPTSRGSSLSIGTWRLRGGSSSQKH